MYAVPGVDDASVGEPGTRACSTDRRSVRAIATGQYLPNVASERRTIGDDIKTDAQRKRQQQEQGRDPADKRYLTLALFRWKTYRDEVHLSKRPSNDERDSMRERLVPIGRKTVFVVEGKEKLRRVELS